jgi:hypothetical protein
VQPDTPLVTRNQTFTGAYTVQPNCTGSITFTGPIGETPADFVIMDGGREVHWIFTAPNGLVARTIAKKQ